MKIKLHDHILYEIDGNTMLLRDFAGLPILVIKVGFSSIGLIKLNLIIYDNDLNDYYSKYYEEETNLDISQLKVKILEMIENYNNK